MSSKGFEEVANSENFRPPVNEDSEEFSISDHDKLDLRTEVFSQIKLLKAVRDHLFDKNGTPKADTEFKDVRAYMSSSTQLLQLLQKLEEVLSTDADFNRVESAIEMALEDCQCPGFVEALRGYLEESSGVEP